MSDDFDKTSDLLAEAKEWLHGDHVFVSRGSKTEGNRTMWIFTDRLTEEQRQALERAESILFALAHKVEEQGPRRVVKGADAP